MDTNQIIKSYIVDELWNTVCRLYELDIDDITEILKLKSIEFDRTLSDETGLIGIAIHALNNLKL